MCLRETAATPSPELLDLLEQDDGNVNATHDGWPLIVSAVLDGKLQDVKYLVESDADIDARNDWGWTALMVAAGNVNAMDDGYPLIVWTVRRRNLQDFIYANDKLEIATYLVERGADVKARDMYGRTALHIATWYGRADVAKVLVAAGADIDAQDKWGESPLHLVAKWFKFCAQEPRCASTTVSRQGPWHVVGGFCGCPLSYLAP